MRLANRLIAQKQFEAALPYCMRAARRYERRNGLHDHETMLALLLAAKLLRRLGHFEKAVEYLASLLTIQEKLLGTDHAEVANTASALGQLYGNKESSACDLDRAATCFQQVPSLPPYFLLPFLFFFFLAFLFDCRRGLVD